MYSSINSSILSDMHDVLTRQRQSYLSDTYPSAKTRIDRISRVIELLVDNQHQLCEAIEEDYGRRSVESTRMQEIMTPIGTLKYARQNVKHWMKADKRRSNFPFNLLGAKSYVKHVPLGVVGNLSPWNFPVALTLAPLGGIFAAGNRAMLKPSEFTPATSNLLARLIAERFDADELSLVLGGADVAAQFSSLPFDHLLFTGSTPVGAKILQATAPNLVPTTLELGGKSPVVITEGTDIKSVAEKVAFAKTSNSGQICIAPDYVLLPEKHRDEFIQHYCNAIQRFYPEGNESPYLTNIISARHRERLQSLLDNAEVAGNKVTQVFPTPMTAGDERFIGPAVVEVDNLDCQIMNEEIFGPLLPVATFKNIDHAINHIQKGSRPLALYLFSQDKAVIERVVDKVICGGMVINDLLMHYLQDDMPFGGVGGSGMGAYHGIEGFKTFSHAKSVFSAPRMDVSRLLRPPYGSFYKRMLDHEISK